MKKKGVIVGKKLQWNIENIYDYNQTFAINQISSLNNAQEADMLLNK